MVKRRVKTKSKNKQQERRLFPDDGNLYVTKTSGLHLLDYRICTTESRNLTSLYSGIGKVCQELGIFRQKCCTKNPERQTERAKS